VAWCALGALAVMLFARAIARAFGPRVGAVAGLVMAAASGLLMLSTSLDGETPYLALVAGGFAVLPGADAMLSRGRVAGWAALSGLACLFRVEHALFFAAATLWMAARALRVSVREAVTVVLVALAAFAAPLVPWEWTAWRAVARFNAEPPPTPPPVRGMLDALATEVAWDPDARQRLLALPAFARDHAEAFVAATVAHRGGRRVAVLVLCGAGLSAGWRTPALVPWLLFLASRAVPAVLFFGYARLGATAIPAIALLMALALTRWVRGKALTANRLRVALAALVLIEAVRFVSGPGLTLDGSAAGPRDPVAVDDHADHRFAVTR
jgi:hypothetical protein